MALFPMSPSTTEAEMDAKEETIIEHNKLQTVPETQPPAAQQSSLSPLVQAAISGDLDTAKLNEMLEIQEKYEAMEARKAYHQAVAEFKANAPTVKKNKRVSYTTDKGTTQYDHASLGYALAEVNPVLSQYGLSLSWKTDQKDGGTYVTAILTHAMGHSEETTLFASPDTSGGKNSIQSIASTVTYLKRHTAFAILGLEAVDADDDGNAAGQEPVNTISEDQLADLRSLLKETGGDEEKFVNFLQVKHKAKISGLKDLPASWYESAVKMVYSAGSKR
jgi:hypothetical protein